MRSSYHGLLRALFAAACWIAGQAAAAPQAAGSTDFKAGVAAFQAQHFAQAVAAFDRARHAGMDSAVLHYNLGASYYRLARYPEARSAFLRVSEEAAMAPLAYYNLGLVAYRQGEKDQARAWFERCRRDAEDAELRRLADRMLGRLDKEQRSAARPAPRWSLYLSTALGYDDNVSLENTDLALSAEKSDEYLDYYAAANGLLAGEKRNGLWLDASLSGLAYQQYSEYDDTRFELGARLSRELGAWEGGAGGYFERIWLGGNEFQDIASLRLQAERPLGADHELRLRYEFSDISELDDSYAYLSGTRQQASAETLSRLGPLRLRLGYTLELNDREDLSSGASFTSYSATRHGLRAVAYLPLGTYWRGIVDGDYRTSRYDDENSTGVRRSDDRYRLALKLRRKLTRSLDLTGAYRYTNNDSNISSRSYSRNQFELGVRLLF